MDEWDRLVTFFDNLHGHWYTGDSIYNGEGRVSDQDLRRKERMMFSADVVRMLVRKFRARARRHDCIALQTKPDPPGLCGRRHKR